MNTFYLKTKEYNNFQFYNDNRTVSEHHVEKLVNSFINDGQLVPIICYKLQNGKLIIVDGQHRFHAAKFLGRPVKYQVDNSLNSESVTVMNTIHKKFTIQDWIKRHASHKKEDYIKLLNVIDDYKGNFSITPIIDVFCLNYKVEGTNAIAQIKLGTYKIDTIKGHKIISTALRCFEQTGNKDFLRAIAVKALRKCIKDHPNFEVQRFLHKIKNKKFNVYSSIIDTYEEIIKIYNFNVKIDHKRLS